MDCIVHGIAKSWTWLSDFHVATLPNNFFQLFSNRLGRLKQLLMLNNSQNLQMYLQILMHTTVKGKRKEGWRIWCSLPETWADPVLQLSWRHFDSNTQEGSLTLISPLGDETYLFKVACAFQQIMTDECKNKHVHNLIFVEVKLMVIKGETWGGYKLGNWD